MYDLIIGMISVIGLLALFLLMEKASRPGGQP